MAEFFAENMWLAWVLLTLACLIIELTSGDFFVMCFAIGALCTAIVSAFTDSLTVQIISFAVFSVLCILFVRPLALKYFHKAGEYRKSNVDALIGRVGKVAEPIETDGFGRVQVDGDYWKAKTADGSPIESGQEVKIKSVDSTIIEVEPVK